MIQREYQVHPDVVLRDDFDDGAVLYDPSTSKAFNMNEIGVLIWNALREKGTVAGCVAELQARCDNAPDDVQGAVADYLQTLMKQGLVGRVEKR